MKVSPTKGKTVRQPLNDVRNVKTLSANKDAGNIKRNLRKRSYKNYRDSSLNDSSINKSKSNIKANKTDHVPVYLKGFSNEKEGKDPFEFTYNTPQTKNKNKGKIQKQNRLPLGSKRGTKKTKDNSWLSDNSVHVIRKTVKKKIAKPVTASKNTPLEKNIKNLVTNNNVNIEKRREYIESINTSTPSTVFDNTCSNKTTPLESIIKLKYNADNFTNKVQDKSRELPSVKNKQLLDVYTKVIVQNNMNSSLREPFRKSVESNVIKEDDPFFGFDEEDENESLLHSNLSNIGWTPRSRKRTITSHNTSDISTTKLNTLTSTPLKNTKVTLRKKKPTCNKLIIHSDITLPTPLVNISQKNLKNSYNESRDQTIGFIDFENSRRLIAQKSPWRSDDVSVTRNPHFLQMKDTSLPCYNQDMVMESRLEESIVSKTPRRIDELDQSSKSIVQTSMLDYFNSSSLIIESSPVKNINQTLFDVDQLSPLKTKPNERINTRASTKTRILGSLSNIENVISFRGNNESSDMDSSEKYCGVENLFGFDEKDKENKRKKPKVTFKESKKGGPVRYSISELKKIREVAVENIIANEVEAVNKDVSVEEVLPVEESQQEETIVGLFEDLIQVEESNHKIYKNKRQRRKRIPSLEEVEEEIIDNGKQQKRKRRDVRTKSEEEQLNNWAAEFNAMCEEVDQYKLETD